MSMDSKKLMKLDASSLAHIGTLVLSNLADKHYSLMIIPQTTLLVMGGKQQELGIMDYTQFVEYSQKVVMNSAFYSMVHIPNTKLIMIASYNDK